MYKDRVINWLKDYKEKTNCKGVVIGISGGKDSTVVAMLAKKVWGKDVFGIVMPNGVQSDIDDAINVCKKLKIKHRVVNLETVYNSLLFNIETKVAKSDITGEKEFLHNCPKISKKAKTNIAPRLRMTVLYAVAQTLGYRVIGTGNASERYIGWFTKYGDGGCDLNPLAHIRCTEVIELGLALCEEFGLPKELIKKKPADGLTGKSDEDNFGFTYKQLDDYMEEHTSGNDEVDSKIEQLHKYSEHKIRMPYTVWDNL